MAPGRKIAQGAELGLTTKEAAAVRAVAEGLPDSVAAGVLYPFSTDSGGENKHKKAEARKRLYALLRRPEARELFKAIVESRALSVYARAAEVLTGQLEDSNQWVAQGAARELLSRYAPVVLGTEQRETVIRIEGMPELGAPALPGSDRPDEGPE